MDNSPHKGVYQLNYAENLTTKKAWNVAMVICVIQKYPAIDVKTVHLLMNAKITKTTYIAPYLFITAQKLSMNRERERAKYKRLIARDVLPKISVMLMLPEERL
ncbi:hypothetical protein ABFA07_018945 [Porites harrisoni]